MPLFSRVFRSKYIRSTASKPQEELLSSQSVNFANYRHSLRWVLVFYPAGGFLPSPSGCRVSGERVRAFISDIEDVSPSCTPVLQALIYKRQLPSTNSGVFLLALSSFESLLCGVFADGDLLDAGRVYHLLRAGHGLIAAMTAKKLQPVYRLCARYALDDTRTDEAAVIAGEGVRKTAAQVKLHADGGTLFGKGMPSSDICPVNVELKALSLGLKAEGQRHDIRRGLVVIAYAQSVAGLNERAYFLKIFYLSVRFSHSRYTLIS